MTTCGLVGHFKLASIVIFSDNELVAFALDSSIFVRPFTDEVWRSIFAMAVIFVLFFLVLFYAKSYSNDLMGWKLFLFFPWLCFVLFYAYYCGALTMFFSSPRSMPFQNTRQGLSMYPDWKMVFLKDAAIFVQAIADKGDEAFARYKFKINYPHFQKKIIISLVIHQAGPMYSVIPCFCLVFEGILAFLCIYVFGADVRTDTMCETNDYLLAQAW